MLCCAQIYGETIFFFLYKAKVSVMDLVSIFDAADMQKQDPCFFHDCHRSIRCIFLYLALKNAEPSGIHRIKSTVNELNRLATLN